MGYTLNFTQVWRHFDKLAYGLVLSLELAVLSITIGAAIGLALAVAHSSAGRAVRTGIGLYVEVVRNVPLLLLVYLVYYGLPQAVNVSYDAPTSFVLTLSLYSGAYLVEVFRSGLAAVPQGLVDAGKSVGLTGGQVLVSVRLPTMLRITLPALSNTFVSLFKDTSIASVIAVPELAYGAQWINTNSFRIVETYLVVTAIYLVAGYGILTILRQVERRVSVVRR